VIPIHTLLARIRWDPAFGRGKWEIAYLDKAKSGLVRMPLEKMRTQPHVRFVFDVVDEEGITHSVPYHRVREVRRDGKLVWSRLAPRTPKREKGPPRATRKRKAPRLRMRP
jgi:uncharacterized protein (UPF0248 family)